MALNTAAVNPKKEQPNLTLSLSLSLSLSHTHTHTHTHTDGVTIAWLEKQYPLWKSKVKAKLNNKFPW